MTLVEILALLLFLFPLAFSPGPGNMFFAANGARFGFFNTLAANFGYHLATIIITFILGYGFSLLFSIIFALSIVFNIYNCYFTYNQKLCSKQISNKGIIWDKGNIINGKSIISSLSSLLYFGSFLILPLFWKSNLKK